MNSTAIEQPVILAIYSARYTDSLNLPPASEIFPVTPLISANSRLQGENHRAAGLKATDPLNDGFTQTRTRTLRVLQLG